ncbi:MAG: N-acetylglucosaminyldiphosphoundecaprenol N-acetyl-beta-D-mannosaminyltransferase [Anaerolineales bacterium]|nr:N-acetylglucosaminyldiphosphoundecaprenol N-acetyl-beta-D-mannosaminyltransferase [Anaerolineales bacterium]
MRWILGTRVDATSYEDAAQQIVEWARRAESRYVCAANVHMLMEAHDDASFRETVNRAALVTPDGMPLVWVMRLLGVKSQQRVYGPELTLRVARAASEQGIAVGLYGGAPHTLDRLARNLKQQFPRLKIAHAFSPPFRSLTIEEDAQATEEIIRSGARILFVGLGCPKQERWMAARQGRLPAVMLGVGAAFDIHAGEKPQAPTWMRSAGLEWLFRLASEPRRLWRRYVYHNPRFVILVLLQLLRKKNRS